MTERAAVLVWNWADESVFSRHLARDKSEQGSRETQHQLSNWFGLEAANGAEPSRETRRLLGRKCSFFRVTFRVGDGRRSQQGVVGRT